MYKQIKLKAKQAGLTTVEYAVAGALIVAAIIAGIAIFGPKLTAALGALLA